MAGMGPAPKHPDNRARRNATVAMTRLPAEGRTGRAPAWPLDADLDLELRINDTKRRLKEIADELGWATTARDRSSWRRKQDKAKKELADDLARKAVLAKHEKKLWVELWKTPQATQWEKLGWVREVALYVRHTVKAEAGSLDDAKEARQRSDRLGLTPLAMLRLRWEIADPAVANTGPAKRSKRNSSKYRGLRVVQ